MTWWDLTNTWNSNASIKELLFLRRSQLRSEWVPSLDYRVFCSQWIRQLCGLNAQRDTLLLSFPSCAAETQTVFSIQPRVSKGFCPVCCSFPSRSASQQTSVVRGSGHLPPSHTFTLLSSASSSNLPTPPGVVTPDVFTLKLINLTPEKLPCPRWPFKINK